MRSRLISSLLLATGAVFAQKIDLKSLDKLAEKAKESSQIDMGPEQLAMASSLLSGEQTGGVDMNRLLKGMQGIHVRTFGFSGPGSYSEADVDPVRKQLSAPGWSRMISIKESGENVEIWAFRAQAGSGMLILTSEPAELTVVNIVGTVDLAAIGKLGGLAGVPGIQSGFSSGTSRKNPAGKKAKEDEDEDEN